MLPIQRMQVWSLVWKLRSHMLPSTAKEIKIKQKQKHFLKSDLGRLNDEKYISRDRASQSLYKRGGGKKARHVSLDQRILEGRGCLTHHYFWDLEQHWPQEMFHEDPLAFLGEVFISKRPRGGPGPWLLSSVPGGSSSPLRWLVNPAALPSTRRRAAPSQVRIRLTDDLKEPGCDFIFLLKVHLFIWQCWVLAAAWALL